MQTVSLKQRQEINHKLKRMGFGGLDDPNLFSQIATLYRTHDAFRGLLMSTAQDQRRIAYEALKPHLCFSPKPLEEYERETKERAEREQWDVYDGTVYPKKFEVQDIKINGVTRFVCPQCGDMFEEGPGENAECTVGGHWTPHSSHDKIPDEKFPRKCCHEYQKRIDAPNVALAEKALKQEQEYSAAKGFLTLNCVRCTKQEQFPGETRVDAAMHARGAHWLLHPKTICPECAKFYQTIQ